MVRALVELHVGDSNMLYTPFFRQAGRYTDYGSFKCVRSIEGTTRCVTCQNGVDSGASLPLGCAALLASDMTLTTSLYRIGTARLSSLMRATASTHTPARSCSRGVCGHTYMIAVNISWYLCPTSTAQAKSISDAAKYAMQTL